MAGIYIHIPFCKSRCTYCDFYTQTDLSLKDDLIEAICKEIIFRKNYLNNETIQTIYFGGGTPSLLSADELKKILTIVYNNFNVSETAEITLEANPDDLSKKYIDTIKSIINRLSIGIQSFDDNELSFLNRRHNAEGAKRAVLLAQEAGINNISIDLMYGLPNQTVKSWVASINQAIKLSVPHVSSYHLIYEEGTPMINMLNNGKIKALNEEVSLEMFSILNTMLSDAGYLRYEISNYAKEGFTSQHNSSYWKSSYYLGIGPSAHSYNGNTRSWNVSSISAYITSSGLNKFDSETELIDPKTAYNDYVLTRLRTMWGANLNEIDTLFGKNYTDYFLKNISEYLNTGEVNRDNENIKITEKGLFISDRIMSDLMYID